MKITPHALAQRKQQLEMLSRKIPTSEYSPRIGQQYFKLSGQLNFVKRTHAPQNQKYYQFKAPLNEPPSTSRTSRVIERHGLQIKEAMGMGFSEGSTTLEIMEKLGIPFEYIGREPCPESEVPSDWGRYCEWFSVHNHGEAHKERVKTLLDEEGQESTHWEVSSSVSTSDQRYDRFHNLDKTLRSTGIQNFQIYLADTN